MLDSSDSCVELFLSLPIAYLRQLKTADVYEHSVEYAGSEPTSGILGHKPGTELAFPKAESHMLNQRSHTNLLVGSTSKWDTKWYYARQHLEPSECNRKNIVQIHSQSAWTSLVDLFLAGRATHVFLDWPLWRSLLLLTKRMPIFAVLPKHYVLEPQNSSTHALKGSSADANFFLCWSALCLLCRVRLCFAPASFLAGRGQSFLARLKRKTWREVIGLLMTQQGRGRERERERARERER